MREKKIDALGHSFTQRFEVVGPDLRPKENRN